MFDTSSFPAVELTLYALLAFSVATWALILVKAVQSFKARSGNKQYAKQFWAASNLQAAADIRVENAPLSRLAHTGFSALRYAGQAATETDLEHSWDPHELLERNLRQQITKEKRALESGLAVLATVGSTAPFVGLFGTVWGIMHAMTDIAKLGNASIDVVAGPIGEALIATGIGIAVAIPAVLGFNFFVRRTKSTVADLDEFAHDFVNLAQRATYRIERQVKPSDVRNLITPVRERAQPAIVGGKSHPRTAEQN